MPVDAKSRLPTQSAKAARTSGGGASNAHAAGQHPAAQSRSAQHDAGHDEVFALMLADLDQRIDAVTERTDAIMARAGLA